MAKTYRQTLGSQGEALAANYLQDHGYTILGRNVRTAYGEIDLIASQEETGLAETVLGPEILTPVVVFVEVKTRRSIAYGLPEESITPQKRAHLLAAIQAYMPSHPELPQAWRVDVIAVQWLKGCTAPEITHFENAFS